VKVKKGARAAILITMFYDAAKLRSNAKELAELMRKLAEVMRK
jgi:hypothetical protein